MEFIDIKAAFKFENQEDEAINIYCDNPGFNFATISSKNICITIGQLKPDIIIWLMGDSKDKFSLPTDKGHINLVKVELPPSKTYKMDYASTHHIDER